MRSITALLLSLTCGLLYAGESEVQVLRRELEALRRALEAQKREYEQKVSSLERRVETLESALEEQKRISREVDRLLQVQQPAGGAGGISQVFNPDISVIFDFLGYYSSKERDRFWLREIEFGFSGYVDPYARADLFVAAHKHEHHEGGEEHAGWVTHIEEGYLTLLELPWDLQLKAGKFKTAFGRVNTDHLHNLPWSFYPLAIQHHLGEEGLAGTGVSLSWLVPNPWDRYIELDYETFNTGDHSFIAGAESEDLAHLLHLKYFHEFSAESTLGMGLSFARQSIEEGHASMMGIDLTYKWRPVQEGLYRSFMWQTELLSSNRDTDNGSESSLGWFTALEYQLSRRWSAGVRLDYSEMPDDSSASERAFSTYLTFRQSEYCFWRFGIERRQREDMEEPDETAIFLQLNFGIGPHRAHKY